MKETLFVADTYKNWNRVGEPFYKNGKLYSSVKTKCDRCTNGIYATRVENGHIVPHPMYNGICLKCNGKGYIEKNVRLYTKDEYDRMTRINEANRIKREAEKEERIKKEYDKKQKKWLEEEGFNEDKKTYVVCGDSYSIKEELKEAGFKYSPILKWHKSTPDNYNCIEVKADEVLTFTAFGTGSYNKDAKEIVEKKIIATNPPSNSEWVAEEKDKIEIPVTVKSIYGYEGKFGYSKIYTFLYNDKDIIKWFTSTSPNINVEDNVIMTTTVKEHSEYNGEKQTIITRPKFKPIA